MYKYIKAQAYSKAEIRDKIEDKTFPIMEAIAQLYLFPDEQEVSHWKREVWANLFKMYKLKGKHKLPTAEFIYQSTWVEYKDSFETAVEAAQEHEYNYVPNIDRLNSLATLYSIMDEYFQWLSSKLSVNNDVKPSEVYEKLLELGL